jgi:hypothetical protein
MVFFMEGSCFSIETVRSIVPFSLSALLFLFFLSALLNCVTRCDAATQLAVKEKIEADRERSRRREIRENTVEEHP